MILFGPRVGLHCGIVMEALQLIELLKTLPALGKYMYQNTVPFNCVIMSLYYIRKRDSRDPLTSSGDCLPSGPHIPGC